MPADRPTVTGTAETALFGQARRSPSRLRPSALRASATTRLAVAVAFAAGLWVAVGWALDWW